jgi:hypothetical protein
MRRQSIKELKNNIQFIAAITLFVVATFSTLYGGLIFGYGDGTLYGLFRSSIPFIIMIACITISMMLLCSIKDDVPKTAQMLINFATNTYHKINNSLSDKKVIIIGVASFIVETILAYIIPVSYISYAVRYMLIIVAFAMFILVLTRKLGGNNNEHTEA